MVVLQVRQCDHCGKKETRAVPVLAIEFKRSDGKRTIGDLCIKCLADMEAAFHLSTTTKVKHHAFTITDPKDIPGLD